VSSKDIEAFAPSVIRDELHWYYELIIDHYKEFSRSKSTHSDDESAYEKSANS